MKQLTDERRAEIHGVLDNLVKDFPMFEAGWNRDEKGNRISKKVPEIHEVTVSQEDYDDLVDQFEGEQIHWKSRTIKISVGV